jgi:hypothetical protein
VASARTVCADRIIESGEGAAVTCVRAAQSVPTQCMINFSTYRQIELFIFEFVTSSTNRNALIVDEPSINASMLEILDEALGLDLPICAHNERSRHPNRTNSRHQDDVVATPPLSHSIFQVTNTIEGSSATTTVLLVPQ